MSRWRLSLVLIACLVAGFPGRASASELGRLTRKVEEVKKKPQEQDAATEMQRGEPVQERMEVETGKDSGAEFAIGNAQYVMTMGPKSKFVFEGAQFEDEELDRWRCKVVLGSIWIYFAHGVHSPPATEPRVLGRLPGEVVIQVGDTDITLVGTAVFLRVERNGMASLYVAEGVAVVGEPGGEVRVGPGQWTMFGPGLPPQPPARSDRRPTQGPFRPEIPGPVLLDPGSLRFDLPKSWVP